jgi:putative membrane protein (TIGR04086 family)
MNKSSRISIKAISIGVLVGLGSSTVLAAVLGIIYGIVLTGKGFTEAEMKTIMTHSFSFLFFGMVISLGCNFLGGFAAGRIAKTSEVMHGGIVGGIFILLSLALFVPLNLGDWPLWSTLIGFLLTIPFCMLGGHVSKITRKKTAA